MVPLRRLTQGLQLLSAPPGEQEGAEGGPDPAHRRYRLPVRERVRARDR